MIKITRYYSPKCLKCGITLSKLLKIGVFFMCDDCYKFEFGNKTPFINPISTQGEKYYEWLKVYNKDANEAANDL